MAKVKPFPKIIYIIRKEYGGKDTYIGGADPTLSSVAEKKVVPERNTSLCEP